MEKSGYLTVLRGEVVAVEDLTREELIAEVISCIDKLEDLDSISSQMETILKEWRNGK